MVICCQLLIEQQSVHTMDKAVFSVGERDLNKQIAMTTTRLGIEEDEKNAGSKNSSSFLSSEFLEQILLIF